MKIPYYRWSLFSESWNESPKIPKNRQKSPKIIKKHQKSILGKKIPKNRKSRSSLSSVFLMNRILRYVDIYYIIPVEGWKMKRATHTPSIPESHWHKNVTNHLITSDKIIHRWNVVNCTKQTSMNCKFFYVKKFKEPKYLGTSLFCRSSKNLFCPLEKKTNTVNKQKS